MWLMKTLLTSGCINQRGAGHPINEQLISHLSPQGWEHINLSGDCVWRTNLSWDRANTVHYAQSLNAEAGPGADAVAIRSEEPVPVVIYGEQQFYRAGNIHIP